MFSRNENASIIHLSTALLFFTMTFFIKGNFGSNFFIIKYIKVKNQYESFLSKFFKETLFENFFLVIGGIYAMCLWIGTTEHPFHGQFQPGYKDYQ